MGKYEYKGDFSNAQMAIAATTMAADLITTVGFDPPAGFRNLDNFAKAVSNRGAGSCDPFRMALAPRFAEVARRYGVGFNKNQLAVFRNAWKLEPDASDEEANEALMNAANFQSFSRAASYRLAAFDIHVAGTRRAM